MSLLYNLWKKKVFSKSTSEWPSYFSKYILLINVFWIDSLISKIDVKVFPIFLNNWLISPESLTYFYFMGKVWHGERYYEWFLLSWRLLLGTQSPFVPESLYDETPHHYIGYYSYYDYTNIVGFHVIHLQEDSISYCPIVGISRYFLLIDVTTPFMVIRDCRRIVIYIIIVNTFSIREDAVSILLALLIMSSWMSKDLQGSAARDPPATEYPVWLFPIWPWFSTSFLLWLTNKWWRWWRWWRWRRWRRWWRISNRMEICQ